VELETDGTKILDTIGNHLDAKRGLSALPKSLHLLYADEVNVSPENSEFFVYAGIAVPGDRAGQLSEEIDELRKKSHLFSFGKDRITAIKGQPRAQSARQAECRQRVRSPPAPRRHRIPELVNQSFGLL
jgi:hypothetical protein